MRLVRVEKDRIPEALAALYNESGMGGLAALLPDRTTMDRAVAQQVLDGLDHRKYVDYLDGRVLKVSFRSDTLNLALYDRDNGRGAGHKALTRHGQRVEIVEEYTEQDPEYPAQNPTAVADVMMAMPAPDKSDKPEKPAPLIGDRIGDESDDETENFPQGATASELFALGEYIRVQQSVPIYEAEHYRNQSGFKAHIKRGMANQLGEYMVDGLVISERREPDMHRAMDTVLLHSEVVTVPAWAWFELKRRFERMRVHGTGMDADTGRGHGTYYTVRHTAINIHGD